MFVLAQVLSFIAMIINIVAVQLKTKKQILLTTVVSNLFLIISYVLLGAYVGALNCSVVAIEIIINTILEDKGKRTPVLLIILYLMIFVLIGFTAFNSIIDFLSILGSTLFVLTFIQSKEKYVRLLILGNLILWIIYDFLVAAYFACISDLFVMFSTITAIYRYDIRKKVII